MRGRRRQILASGEPVGRLFGQPGGQDRVGAQRRFAVLRQRLLNTIHRLNQDAYELREARDSVEQVSVKLA